MFSLVNRSILGISYHGTQINSVQIIIINLSVYNVIYHFFLKRSWLGELLLLSK